MAALTALPSLGLSRGRKRPGRPARTSESRRGLGFALAALACLGTLSFFYKLAALEGVPAPALMFIQFSFFSPSAMAWAALRRRFAWHPASAGHGLAAGVLLSLALILLVAALSGGEAGVMVPINQMSFVLTAVLAVPWFGETWTARKTAAAGLAAGAVVLLSG